MAFSTLLFGIIIYLRRNIYHSYHIQLNCWCQFVKEPLILLQFSISLSPPLSPPDTCRGSPDPEARKTDGAPSLLLGFYPTVSAGPRGGRNFAPKHICESLKMR